MLARSVRFTRSRRSRSSLGALAIVAAVGLGVLGPVAAPTALAQRGMMRMGMNLGGVGERITVADMNRYADLLKLNADQRDALTALHEAYGAEYDQAEQARRDAINKVRLEFEETRDPAVWGEQMPAIGQKYAERVKALDETFMKDIRALLTPDQSERIAMVERARRRDAMLPAGLLAGETTDLTRVVSDLMQSSGTPMPDALAQSLERYESELDAALRERDVKREEIAKTMPGMGGGGGGAAGFDPQAFQKAMTDLRKAGLSVRNINDRYADLLANVVPAEKKDDFVRTVRQSKFPQVYRDPYALRAIDAAAAFDDLAPDTKRSIAEIKAAYERDLAAANERWSRAIAEEEKDGGGDLMGAGMMRWMGGGNDDGDSPQQVARRQRRDLDRAALDKLRALLTPEQQERLPERDAERPSMFGGGAGGGGGGSGGGRGR
jgi:Spy/CpxP family protein refolding chaperone